MEALPRRTKLEGSCLCAQRYTCWIMCGIEWHTDIGYSQCIQSSVQNVSLSLNGLMACSLLIWNVSRRGSLTWKKPCIQQSKHSPVKSLGVDLSMVRMIDSYNNVPYWVNDPLGDPHPGNVLVRRHPKHHRDIQVVIIDHGLYIQESEKWVTL